MIYSNRDPRIVLARKTADETIVNDVVLTNDADLKFTVPALSIWHFSLRLIWSAHATPDIRMAWDYPALATMWWWTQDMIAGLAAGIPITPNAETDPDVNAGAGGAFRRITVIDGVYMGGANAGTLNFQWCQETTSGNGTNVYKNSALTGIRVG